MYMYYTYIVIHETIFIHKSLCIAKWTRHSDMRWLRLVGSLKSYVSFAKEPYKRDYILQKRRIILEEPTNRSRPILVCIYNIYIYMCTRFYIYAITYMRQWTGHSDTGMYIYVYIIYMYSLLHLECHFSNLEYQSMF